MSCGNSCFKMWKGGCSIDLFAKSQQDWFENGTTLHEPCALKFRGVSVPEFATKSCHSDVQSTLNGLPLKMLEKMDLIFDIMSKRNPYQKFPNKPASLLTFYDLSKVLFSDVIWFDIESISMSQVWDLSIWWFARLLHCKAFAAFWNLTKELLVWNLGFGRSPEISGELPCW